MDKEAHKFKEFFTLIDLTKKTTNKKVVCNFCIKEYTLSVASCRTGYFVSNKAKLCHAYLKKCINFERQVPEVPETKRIEILAWKISKDNKKIIKKQKNNKGKSKRIVKENSDEDSSEENKENKKPLKSITKTQFCITNYVSRSLSKKDAKLCHAYLKKCINFERQVPEVPETKRIEILAWKISKDNKKIIKKQKNNKGKSKRIVKENSDEDSSEENKENKKPLKSITKTQFCITNYVSRSLSKKDVPYFEILLL
ncbi:hypothetical protein Glove_194g2 [Diversispora epigaea]|uniref:Uncharacterized protein n=1 Tax=Diversispora epigaea TaxID=1348612 RepID=A0A397ISF0_9GLOM|nr:hypothetical protein Glove_194g2 [Diversispora epigaea]